MIRNPLNDYDVDGNSVAYMIRQELLKDEYYCTSCKEHVSEDKFNHKHCVCYSCFWRGEL